MENFYSLGLPEALLNRLEAIQYQVPTPIQAQTIPHALQGLDVLGTAQTGTGKTAAYVIPLVYHLMHSADKTALILTPTREIAIQVTSFLNKLLDRKSEIRTALIIGGDSMSAQMNQIRMKPRLIVGTPGRVNDHLERGTLKLDKTSLVVLDETDRMLDMGFSIQLEQIFKFLPEKRQTLMFSATLPQNILKIANQQLNNPMRISVGSTITAADTITQEVIHTSEDNKYDVLLEQLELREGSVIIFVKTKFSTERLAKRLRENGHAVDAIHGDLRQRNRERVMHYFRNKKNRILVATDIAARGLDIAHVECVINHDLPQCEEDFIHRIGRTGRAGMEGVAVSLITPQDHLKWRNINKMMNPNAKIDLPIGEKNSSRKRSRNNSDRFKRKPENEFASRTRTFGEKRQRNDRPSYDMNNSARDENRPSRSPNRFAQDSRSAGGFGRSNNNAGPARDGNRSSRNSNRFGQDSRPGGFGRPSNNAGPARDGDRTSRGPNRFGQDSRPGGFGRPSNNAGPARDGDRTSRGPNRFGQDSRPGGFGRPSNNAGPARDGNRSSRGSKFGQDTRSGGFGRPSNNRPTKSFDRPNKSFTKPRAS